MSDLPLWHGIASAYTALACNTSRENKSVVVEYSNYIITCTCNSRGRIVLAASETATDRVQRQCCQKLVCFRDVRERTDFWRRSWPTYTAMRNAVHLGLREKHVLVRGKPELTLFITAKYGPYIELYGLRWRTVDRCASAEKVHFRTVTFIFEPTTLNMSPVSCRLGIDKFHWNVSMHSGDRWESTSQNGYLTMVSLWSFDLIMYSVHFCAKLHRSHEFGEISQAVYEISC